MVTGRAARNLLEVAEGADFKQAEGACLQVPISIPGAALGMLHMSFVQ
jgi:hypothetical protein